MEPGSRPVEQRPPGLSEEEWQAVRAVRSRRPQHAEMDVLAEKIAEHEDRYARQRTEDLLRSLTTGHPLTPNEKAILWICIAVMAMIVLGIMAMCAKPPVLGP